MENLGKVSDDSSLNQVRIEINCPHRRLLERLVRGFASLNEILRCTTFVVSNKILLEMDFVSNSKHEMNSNAQMHLRNQK